MKKKHKISIAVHGGASNIKSMELTQKQQKAYKGTLSAALDSGYLVLKQHGKAADAVVAAIKVMEDSPLFNAGYGSVFANDRTIRMEAAIMGGATLRCGAVADVSIIKNPIIAARKIMEYSPFVFLMGEGAEKFAEEQGVEIVSPEYFKTEFRWQQFLKAQEKDTVYLDNEASEKEIKDKKGSIPPIDELKNKKYGTVGCVAIDVIGNLAAGTSTGGLVNKKYGRIGDSPIIGVGTYANNKTCAISCTGKGEEFIKLTVAHDISALMEYKHYNLKRAADNVINKLIAKKGRGGCIAIDSKGKIYMTFTTSGMFRGKIDTSGKKSVAIFE